jgi:L-threonylcarbamoyladenylate synthase
VTPAAGLSSEDATALARVIDEGGAALFPADTVYGLATHPESELGLRRLYEMKGRPAERPSAVMFFRLDGALEALADLGPRTREALERLLPGPLTVVLANPGRRFPLACGPTPERLGVRVPALGAALAALGAVHGPVLQTSANLSGRSDARRLGDVDPAIRRAVDLELDAGELPGVPSTVVDLTGFELERDFSVVREGAVTARDVEDALLG